MNKKGKRIKKNKKGDKEKRKTDRNKETDEMYQLYATTAIYYHKYIYDNKSQLLRQAGTVQLVSFIYHARSHKHI
jgi:hypothetical protein